MAKQKKRKGGSGDKKKGKANHTRANAKRLPDPTSAPGPGLGSEGLPGPGAAAPVDKMPVPSMWARGGSAPPSWVDEICEMAAEAKLSPKSSEKLLSLATDPTLQSTYNRSRGSRKSSRSPPAASSRSSPRRQSNARVFDTKSPKGSPARKTRRQSIGDAFVASALMGNLPRLRHLRCQVAIDCTNQKWGWTALMAASSNGHLACSRYLVTCKACLNGRERSGWTAVMLAARAGKMDIVEYLISMGADVKPRTSNSITVYGLGSKNAIGRAIQRGLQRRREREVETCWPWREDIIDWQFEDVRQWLLAVGCLDVQNVFRDNMVNGEALLDLSDEDIDDILDEDEDVHDDTTLRNRVKQAIYNLRDPE